MSESYVEEGDAPEVLAPILAAAEGLLMPSESDYPFEPFSWPGSEPLTPAALLEYLDLPPDTPVEERAFDAFFARLSAPRDWHADAERAIAEQFGRLRDAIAANLNDLRVYRVGEIQIAVFIVGTDPTGATVGLRTMVIET